MEHRAEPDEQARNAVEKQVVEQESEVGEHTGTCPTSAIWPRRSDESAGSADRSSVISAGVATDWVITLSSAR
jgi:hypothetical protein